MRTGFQATVLDCKAELVTSLWLNVKDNLLLYREQWCACDGHDADEAEHWKFCTTAHVVLLLLSTSIALIKFISDKFLIGIANVELKYIKNIFCIMLAFLIDF